MKILIELDQTTAEQYALLAIMARKNRKDLYLEALNSWIKTKQDELRKGLALKSINVGNEGDVL